MYYNPSCNIFITVWLKKLFFLLKQKHWGKRFVCQIAIIENLECRAVYLMVISWGSSIKNIIFTSFRYIFRKLHQYYYYFCMHLWIFFSLFSLLYFLGSSMFSTFWKYFFVKIRLLTKHKNVPNCFASEIPRSFVQNLKNLY